MALSGSLNTNAYNGRYLQFTWTATQSTSDNSSTISWTLKGAGTSTESGVEWYKAGPIKVVIGSETVYSNSSRIDLYSGTTVASGTKTITHNDNGSKTFTVSVQGAIFYTNINATGSKTFTLNTIDRYPTTPVVSSPTTNIVTETTKEIEIKWTKSDKGTYTVEMSKNGGNYSAIKTGISNSTLTYKHSITPKQGDTYKFRVKAVYNSLSSSYSYSGTITLNKLQPPTIGTLSIFNPYVNNVFIVPLTGGSQMMTGNIKRKADVYMTDANGNTKKWYRNDSSITYNNTSVNITVPAAEVLTALGIKRYKATFTVIAWIENANGSRSEYITKNTTVDINTDGKAVPTINNPTFSGGYVGYTSTCFVADIHDINVSTSASGNRYPSGTTPTLKYTIACSGLTTINSSSGTFVKPTAGRKAIVITATDDRGLKATKTVYIRVQSWTKPTVTILAATRNSDIPTSVVVEASIKYSPIYDKYTTDDDGVAANKPGTNINDIQSIQYASLNAYSNFTATTNPFYITIQNLNADIGYTIKVRASDKFKPSVYSESSKFVGTAHKHIAIRSNGVGLGCVPGSSYKLDVCGAVRVYDSNGELRIQNGTVYVPNGKYYYSYRSDGTTPHALLAMNSADAVVLNYTGYNAEIGETRIYGNAVKVLTKSDITLYGELKSSYNVTLDSARFTSVNTNGSVSLASLSHRGIFDDTLNRWIICTNAQGNTSIYNDTATIVFEKPSDTDTYNGFFRPHEANKTTLGTTAYPWYRMYAYQATSVTSDEREKHDIVAIKDLPCMLRSSGGNILEQLFFKLTPKTYRMNQGDTNELHIGFIAQDISNALNELDILDEDIAVINHEYFTDEDGNDYDKYALAYQEFIALNTYMIQKQQEEINQLKQIINGGE